MGELVTVEQPKALDATAEVDLFGPVDRSLTLADVRRGIRGVSRPRDLRPLIAKSDHDPMTNLLELAMQAKAAGNTELAWTRFMELLPYVWTKVNGAGVAAGMMQAQGEGGGAGEVIYRWATPSGHDEGQSDMPQ